ncbi:MAG: hypothetical protein AAF581_09060 [Planctomycetota bacterium]
MTKPTRQSVRLSHQSGFTLLEMAISGTVLVVILGAVLLTLVNASAEVRAGVWETDLDVSARRVVDRLAAEITTTGEDLDGTNFVISHPPGTTTTASEFTFRSRVALAGNAGDWSNPIRYALADSTGEIPDNGIDDDGDGAVDEQALTRTQDDIEKVVVDGVIAFTIVRNAGDHFVTLTLTLARPNRIGMDALERTTTTSIRFRNLSR